MGQRVEITRGAWAGYTAVIVERDGLHRVRVRFDATGGYRWFETSYIRHLVD